MMTSGASPLSPDILDFLRMYVHIVFTLGVDRIKLPETILVQNSSLFTAVLVVSLLKGMA